MNRSRRQFLTTIATGTAALTLGRCQPRRLSARPGDDKKKKKKHILTLSFDDGFKKSSIKTAEIYEKYGFSACLNIIASGHLKTFKPDSAQKGFPMGDFGLWNELKKRGHEIHPHGYRHAALGQKPLNEAKDLVRRCLDMMSKELKGFDPKKAVYAFPYGSTSPEVNAWLVTRVRAVRFGRGPNPLPHKGLVHLGMFGFSRDPREKHVDRAVDELLAADSGWQVVLLHGLDGEGHRPLRSDYLDGLLKRLSAIESVDVLPPIQAFEKYASSD